MNDLVILRVEEWQCLYVNGTLTFEHHSVEIEMLSRYVPIRTLVSVHIAEGSPLDEYVTEHGGFPDTLEDSIQIQHSLQRYQRKEQ